ncbi:MAG TPA: TIGR03621 family F420-dependent LLM class oxidoreductase [Candidatus Limnocylindria bacterium]|nr:TIGR03621 family F420-dependent LLM class oxidoreductase [Candidatus Limnocylindria bacterium]
MPRPFRFGVTARWAGGGTRWREFARRAEAQGYDVLLVTDHMGPQVAPIPAMMAALDATERLRVGSFVFSNDYRNPVILAKEIATMDVISGGRVELGIGAGWRVPDYRQLGIPYDAPAVRVARLEEAVHLIDRLLREEVVDHHGTYYTVREVRLLPRPVQQPRPPFMIGGGGPRLLRLASRSAEIVSFAPSLDAHGRPRPRSLTSGGLRERVSRARKLAGDRDPELNVWLFDAGVSDNARTFRRAATTTAKRTANALLRSPFFLYGTRSSLKDLLRERREELGISYISVPGQAMDEFAPIAQELRGT